MCIYIYWLVVSTPLKNMKVSYDYYIFTRKMEKNPVRNAW